MLEATNIHKFYRQANSHLRVLKGIYLKIQAGDVLAIVGPSGAGKSTLLHILGGLDEPSEGKVVIEGEEIYRLNDVQRAKIRNQKVGFVFQFYHLLPEFSALENVMLPALVNAQNFKLRKLENDAEDLLEQVGLKERVNHKPSELSGGEQQRVAIARALINRPKIIFCDEPTGNLDTESSQSVIKLLLDLNIKNKQTVVIVTHDEDIARRSHKIIRIRDGRLLE